jgi:Flp pilus assembly protein TadG
VRRLERGAALVEFALAWPVALLIVLASVEAAVWANEAYSARAASLAGAHAGAVARAGADAATQVTLAALSAGLIGVAPAAWCPGLTAAPPPVWVCSIDRGSTVEVEVVGSVPALVPVFDRGLPLHADVVVQKEQFSP